MPPLRLEIFPGNDAAADGTVVTNAAALEEARLAAFEQGYSAGWEDAGKAEAGEQTRIRGDLARHLQALAFTYQEARNHVLTALEPLLLDVLTPLLPEIAKESLPRKILDVILPLAASQGDSPLRLMVNPAAHSAVESLLAEVKGLPVQVVDEPSLGDGQAYLQMGEGELHFDPAGAAETIATNLHNFFALLKEDAQNGHAL